MSQRTVAAALLLVSAMAPWACGVAWSAPAAASTPAAGLRELRWEELVPKGWDPLKRFREANVGMFNDSDPRVQALMRELREAWDNAPTNDSMNGAAGRLPGYLIPLEDARGLLKEFLLVPYYGACIHSPPPPANQIVHVVLNPPVKGFRMMDAVWVTGTLKTERQDSPMGRSGYQMQAVSVQPYVPKARR